MVRQAGRVHADTDQRRRGDERDDGGLERKIDRVQDAERGAGVAHVREIDQTRDDRHALVQRQAGADHRLGRLIDEDDGDRQKDFEPARPRPGIELARNGGFDCFSH